MTGLRSEQTSLNTARSEGAPIAGSNQQSLSDTIKQSIRALPGMDRVETLIRSKLVSDAPQLEEIPRYLLDLGGKRIRPALSLFVSRSLGIETAPQELIDVAAGIELIHMATLLHDDIIDKSPLRRHKESPLLKFGIPSTLLAGDFLLVRAFSLCAHLDDFIVEETEKACIELTEGEILELPLYEQEHDLNSSLLIAQKKTASLFRLACVTSAHISSEDKDIRSVFAEFGQELGLAFQILDDLLDVTSPADLLGKKTGGDLLERKPSIVNVLWLESGSDLAKSLLHAPDRDRDQQFVEEALQEIGQSEVVARTRELARQHAERASKALSRLPENVDSSSLELLIRFCLERLH